MPLTKTQITSIRETPKAHTVANLKAYVASKGIVGVSTMTKPDLVKTVKQITAKRKDIVGESKMLKVKARKGESNISLIKRSAQERSRRKKKIKDNEKAGYPEPLIWEYQAYGGINRYRVAWTKNGYGDAKGMYNVLNNYLNNRGQFERLRYIVLYIRTRGDNSIRYMTVQASNLDMESVDGFDESIESMIRKKEDADDDKVGSDEVNEDKDEYIEYSKFDMATTHRYILRGESNSIYKSMGIKGGKNGMCAVRCLQEILKKDYDKKDVSYYEGLAEICRDENIDILLGTTQYNLDLFKEDATKRISLPDKKNPRRKVFLYPMNKEKAIPMYTVKHDAPLATIMVDMQYLHADVIRGTPELKNIYFGGEKLYVVSDDLTTYEEMEKYTIRTMVTDNMQTFMARDAKVQSKRIIPKQAEPEPEEEQAEEPAEEEREPEREPVKKHEQPATEKKHDDARYTRPCEQPYTGGANVELFGEYRMKCGQDAYPLLQPTDLNKAYIYIDYETVVDFSDDNVVVPASIQFYVDTLQQPEVAKPDYAMLAKCSKEYRKQEEDKYRQAVLQAEIAHNEKVRDKTVISYGRNCTQALIDVIQKMRNTAVTVVTYNGARFDNFILYRELQRLAPDTVGGEFFVKNELLTFTFGNGLHSTIDLYKHLHLSMKDACDGFQIKGIKKGNIDFYKIQEKYDELETEEFDKYLAENKEFKEYAINDIVCLQALLHKYVTTVRKMAIGSNGECDEDGNVPVGRRIDPLKFQTYGGMMKKVFSNHLHHNKISMPQIKDYKVFEDLRKSRTGGRVQLFNEFERINQRIVSMDASGCYVYCMAVMKDAWYPCGEIVQCDKYESMPADKIGFFYCTDINQKKLKVKIIPKKSKGENAWGHNEVIKDEMLLSTVVIDDLKAEKCTLKIGSGFYFSDRVKGCDLFEFLLPLMSHKSKQDILKEKKDPDYNPALRTILKSFMLILSGKLAEGLYRTKTVVIKPDKFQQLDKADPTMTIHDVVGSSIVCDIAIDEKTAMKKSKPIYLSTLIYDYSHRYMNTMYKMFKPKQLICTSTDSLKVRHTDYLKVEKQLLATPLQHWPEVEKYDDRYKTAKMLALTSVDKVIGSFVDEYVDKDYAYGLFFRKGCYYLSGEKDKNITYSGISGNDVPLSSIDEYKDLTAQEMNTYYHTAKTINDDPDKFFNNYFDKKETYVMCQSLRRDSSRNEHILPHSKDDKR
jgi:hypothetical protein